MAIEAARIGACVSLGQGVPSFATPPPVVDAMCRVLQKDPSCGKYSLQTGMPALRTRLARLLHEEKNIEADPETEICVTVGGMEALLCTVLTLVDEGDEVILPSPSYASYIEQILLAGGNPVFAPLDKNWGLDLAALEQSITPKTRAIMLCTPGNPTGNALSNEEILALCTLAEQYNLALICDETYDYLVYDNISRISPFSLPRFRERVVLIASLSKKYALTGWRVGWVTASRPLMQEIMKVHDATAICAPTPSQHAALAALEDSSANRQWLAATKAALYKRRDLCCARLERLHDFFSFVPPQGAFYVMARYLFSQEDALSVALRILHEARVITIPTSGFGKGGEGHLRLSFGGEESEINEAFDRMERWLKR
ncbi:MAG: pyridoxal phosphate-dependent aminotransferase [Desulfobulbaceae bacterium]|nr:pyridoxal phosphate-dependent aminotransferase [Desulfobulbaceae bacterium]